MSQRFPLEVEFDLTRIYHQIDDLDSKTVKNSLKKIIRNIYVAEMFSKKSDLFIIQKKKIMELLFSEKTPERSHFKEEEIEIFLRSINIPETKIASIIQLVKNLTSE